MEPFQGDRTAHSEDTGLLPVPWIAGYQLVRAFGLLVSFVVFWGAKDTNLASHSVLAMIVFLTTRRVFIQQEAPMTSVLAMIAVLAIIYAVSGFGLLSLNEHARRMTICISALAVLRMLFLLAIYSSLKLAAPPYMQLVMAVLLILDVLVIASLINAADAFE